MCLLAIAGLPATQSARPMREKLLERCTDELLSVNKQKSSLDGDCEASTRMYSKRQHAQKFKAPRFTLRLLVLRAKSAAEIRGTVASLLSHTQSLTASISSTHSHKKRSHACALQWSGCAMRRAGSRRRARGRRARGQSRRFSF